MGVVAAIAVVCLIIGFILGTRGRQIVASAMVMGSALKTCMVRIPEAASIMGQQTNKEDDGGENDEMEGEEDGDEDQLKLEDLIQPAENDPALSDHPDVKLNPVIMYKIKRSKEEMRVQQRRAALLAEGLTASEVEERMEIEAVSGTGGGSGQKTNPLALLVSLGARVEASAGGGSQEAVQMQERRRLQRNVDAYLQKAEGIEKFRSEKMHAARDPISGGRLKTAHEIAKDTGVSTYGGGGYKRAKHNVHVAKDARNIYRRWKASNPALLTQLGDEKTSRRGGAIEQIEDLSQVPEGGDGEEEAPDEEGGGEEGGGEDEEGGEEEGEEGEELDA